MLRITLTMHPEKRYAKSELSANGSVGKHVKNGFKSNQKFSNIIGVCLGVISFFGSHRSRLKKISQN